MSITPQLSDGLVGKFTKKISDSLYLDVKDTWGIHRTLEVFALELMRDWEDHKQGHSIITEHDPGDESDNINLPSDRKDHHS